MIHVLEHAVISKNVYLFGISKYYGTGPYYELVIYPDEENIEHFAKKVYSGWHRAIKATLDDLNADGDHAQDILADFVARCKSRM